MTNSSSRRGFTLVELLVVIAIIGILAAITVPAVQAARRAARRAQCLNNQKNLGVAVKSYTSAKNHYPPSFYEGIREERYNWIVALLPHLDRENVRDSINVDAQGLLSDVNVRGFRISQLVCPMEPIQQNFAQLSYVANMGRAEIRNPNSGQIPGRPINAGDLGFLDYKGSGVFYDRSLRGGGGRIIKLDDSDVYDGTANTIMFSENPYATTWSYTPTAIDVNPGFGSTYTNSHFGMEDFQFEFRIGIVWQDSEDTYNQEVDGMHHFESAGIPTQLPLGFADDSNLDSVLPTDAHLYARPASFHTKGFVVAFCDGSTKFISSDIDYSVYARLMTADSRKVKPLASGGISLGKGVVDEDF